MTQVWLRVRTKGRVARNMAGLVLHIGHPKTGTTALQTVFAANAAALLRAGVLYPVRSDPTSTKHALAKPYLTGSDTPTIRRHTGLAGAALSKASGAYWARLCAEVAEVPHHTVILSAESFFAWPLPADFRRKLAALCDRVTVVAYLRSPAQRVLSQMNQNLRMVRAFEMPPAAYYRPVIEAYDAAGVETLCLNVFAPSRLVSGDIVADFAAKHLPGALPPLTRTGAERGNESVSNEAMVLLEQIARRWPVTPPHMPDRRRAKAVAVLRRADRAVGGALRPSLKPDVAAALVARSTDLVWLRDARGVRFDDVDYAAIGAAGLPDVTALRDVRDFCPVDEGRMAALRGATETALVRIYGGRWQSWRHAAGWRQ